MTNPQDLERRVAEHTGLSPDAARKLVGAVVRRLSEQLSPAAAEAFASELPPSFACEVQKTEHGRAASAEALYAQVGRDQKLRVGVAFEQTRVVCEALAHTLRPEALHALVVALPNDVAALLSAVEDAPPFERAARNPAHHTLAEGAGGGSHPLYSSRFDNAQSESVARTDNPHGDTKISSARGLTQEREHASVATARPQRRPG